MADWMSDTGDFGDMSGAPESVSELVGNKGFKNISDFAKSYTEMESYKGQMSNKLNLPAEMTDDMRSQIHDRFRPESADKYDIGDSADGLKPDMLSGITEAAFSLGLSNDQVKGVVSKINELGNLQIKDYEAQAIATEEQMKEEMGDKFQPFIDGAISGASKLGILEVLNNKELMADKDILTKLNAVNIKLSEDIIKSGTGNTSAASKKDRKKEIEANPAFLNKMHPEHPAMHKEWLDTMLPG